MAGAVTPQATSHRDARSRCPQAVAKGTSQARILNSERKRGAVMSTCFPPRAVTPPTPSPKQPSPAVPPVIWWAIWFAMVASVAVLHALELPAGRMPTEPQLRYLPLMPLLASAAVRWLVLPRFRERARTFPIFIIGMALAEGSGILGLFLVPDLKATYLLLALLGLAQYLPSFILRGRT